jgi:sulfur carrier protein ThiS adenylyltransferase
MTLGQISRKLAVRTVGIAGCGGLGSNCAVALARVGVGTLILVDFDTVSETNLNRQYYFSDQIGKKKVLALRENILRINPCLCVITHDIKLDSNNILSVFQDCDVIVEAFDLADQKEMLIETVLTGMPGKDLVIGLGMAGFGMNELIHYRKLDRLHICGDEVTEITEEMPPLAPRVGIVANMQANTVIEILIPDFNLETEKQ